jgi:hypothetical protein
MICGSAEEGNVVNEFHVAYFYDFRMDVLLKDQKITVAPTMLLVVVRN